MERKKLIFFAAADPRTDPGPAWSAYHFANVAAGAGLDAEVRLAGDAVRVARPDGVQESPKGLELREKSRAGADAPYLVSL
jgi:hypothetical protein